MNESYMILFGVGGVAGLVSLTSSPYSLELFVPGGQVTPRNEPEKAKSTPSGNGPLFIEPEGCMVLGSRHPTFENCFTALFGSWRPAFRGSASVVDFC